MLAVFRHWYRPATPSSARRTERICLAPPGVLKASSRQGGADRLSRRPLWYHWRAAIAVRRTLQGKPSATLDHDGPRPLIFYRHISTYCKRTFHRYMTMGGLTAWRKLVICYWNRNSRAFGPQGRAIWIPGFLFNIGWWVSNYLCFTYRPLGSCTS